MSFLINNVATVWLDFNTTYQIIVDVYASWNETVELSDPCGLLANVEPYTSTGTPAQQSTLGTFTTPSNFGDFPSYPVNVTITNNGGGAYTLPSYVNIIESNTVTSYDWMQNSGKNNLEITFTPN